MYMIIEDGGSFKCHRTAVTEKLKIECILCICLLKLVVVSNIIGHWSQAKIVIV